MIQEYNVRKYLAEIGIDDAALGRIAWDHALDLAEVASAGIELAEKEAKRRRRKGKR